MAVSRKQDSKTLMPPPSPKTTNTFKIHKAQKLARSRTHQANRLERHRAMNSKYLTGALAPTIIPSGSHCTISPPLNYGSSVRAVSDTPFNNVFSTPIWDNTTIPSSLVPILEGDAFDKGKGNRNYPIPFPSCILTNDHLSEAYKHMDAPHTNRPSNIEVVKYTRCSASEHNPADPTALPSLNPSSQPHYTTNVLYASFFAGQRGILSSSPSSPAASSPAACVRVPAPVPLSLASPPPSPTSPFFPHSPLPFPRRRRRCCRNRVYTGLNTQLRRRFSLHYPYTALSSSSSSSSLSSSSSSSSSTSTMPPLTIKSLQLGNGDGTTYPSASTIRTLLADYDAAFTRWDAAMCANERRGVREFQSYADKDALARVDAYLRGLMATMDKRKKNDENEQERERRKRTWNRDRKRKEKCKGKDMGKRKGKERFTTSLCRSHAAASSSLLSGMSKQRSKSRSKSISRLKSLLIMLTKVMEWDIWGRRRWYLLRNLAG